MSAYDNDSRVIPNDPIDPDTFELPDGDGRSWFVVRQDGVWNSYNSNGDFVRLASHKETADEAIYDIVGDPE